MKPNPILVGGMHRSGTSLVGSLLASFGVNMGSRLVPADERNARGYFEDAEIVAFHGRAFEAVCPAGPGHRDWGWTEQGEVEPESLACYRSEAEQLLVARRELAQGPFGFKDPRVTMALKLWDGLADEVRWVFVYRHPWEVADSMQRVGAPVFTDNPSYGYRIWTAYNRRVADFVEANRDRCLLLSVNALPDALDTLPSLFERRLGLASPTAAAEDIFDRSLLTTAGADDQRAALIGVAYPECTKLLERLDRLADISSDGLWAASPDWRPSLCKPSQEPAVSIIVPTYHDGVFLLDALASVERTQPSDTELIIVNDGSPDPETRRIVGALSRAGYRVIEQENQGLGAARNAGIAASRGRYILPLDADNRLRPHFVEAAASRLDVDPDVDVVYGDRELFGDRRGRVRVPEFDLAHLLGGNQIDACAMYRRELWEDLGGYDTAMYGLEDWEFWIHAGERGWNFAHCGEVTFDYRVRPGSMLSSCLREPNRRALFARLLERHPEILHHHVPAPMRAASGLLRLLGREPRRTKRWESHAFWRPFWWLAGPGGVLNLSRRSGTG